MGGKVTNLESLLNGIEAQIMERRGKTDVDVACKTVELAQKEIHHREFMELMTRVETKLDVLLEQKRS
jgi:hypothetical protein